MFPSLDIRRSYRTEGNREIYNEANTQSYFFYFVRPILFVDTPKAILAVVDLPDPLGPMSVTISPAETLMDTPRTSQRFERLMPALSRDISVLFSFSMDLVSVYGDSIGSR